MLKRIVVEQQHAPYYHVDDKQHPRAVLDEKIQQVSHYALSICRIRRWCGGF